MARIEWVTKTWFWAIYIPWCSMQLKTYVGIFKHFGQP